MQELVEYIVKQLVSNPDAVIVEEHSEPGMTTLLLTVAPEDMGLVIGKSGQTIKAVRRILTIRAMSDNVRVNLELKETGDGPRKEVTNEEASHEEEVPIEEPEEKKDTEEPAEAEPQVEEKA